MNFKMMWIILGILLLNFVAFAQIPSDANLRIQASNLSPSNYLVTISNTVSDIQYEIQRKQGKTNWISEGFRLGPETSNWMTFNFKVTNAIGDKTIFRVRSWIDSDNIGIPDWWQLKYFGTIGIDGYANPEGDGWNNLQKYQNGMDPFDWYQPAAPHAELTFRQGKDALHDNGILSWQYYNGPTPDFFIIERANRTRQRMTNNLPPFRYGVNNRILTNRPPFFHPPFGRPGWPLQQSFVTGPYEIIAQVPGRTDIREYQYIDTNIDAFSPPLYRIQAHFQQPASFPKLTTVTTEIVRKTILSVTAKQETNGYVLTVLHPALHVRYLLLVRDKNEKQWRASGYFVSGTNGNPVHLHVDKMGMMTDPQSPISLPPVKFLPNVMQPEFVAGYGEDSDGDYLPDIYEVLVTHTDPANDDTDDTGIIDGFKKMTSDSISNLEKFRSRVDPLHPAQPPATVELKQPTGREILQALSPKSDLSCEVEIEVRTNGATDYQPIEQVPWFFSKIMNFREPDENRNFDLRISWHFANNQSDGSAGNSYRELPAEYQAIEPLMAKINVQLFKAFKANLGTNPPISTVDVSNKMVSLMYSYHQGEIDKGVAMAEMILLQNYQPQDFYGKVIDQDGNLLADVSITGNLELNDGTYGGTKIQSLHTITDKNGLFEFTGIHGTGLSILINKSGYENEWKNDAYKNPSGSRSSPTDRTIYRMWSTNIHEQLITGNKSFEILPDGKPHFINLTDGTISESFGGDLKVWIQYTNQPVRGQLYDWSAGIEAVNGGLLEVQQAAMNSGFLDGFYIPMFTAPTDAYVPSFILKSQIKGGQSGEIGNRYFYLLLNNGKEYGRMSINLFAPYGRLHPGLIRLSYAINPSGSRILR